MLAISFPEFWFLFTVSVVRQPGRVPSPPPPHHHHHHHPIGLAPILAVDSGQSVCFSSLWGSPRPFTERPVLRPGVRRFLEDRSRWAVTEGVRVTCDAFVTKHAKLAPKQRIHSCTAVLFKVAAWVGSTTPQLFILNCNPWPTVFQPKQPIPSMVPWNN